VELVLTSLDVSLSRAAVATAGKDRFHAVRVPSRFSFFTLLSVGTEARDQVELVLTGVFCEQT